MKKPTKGLQNEYVQAFEKEHKTLATLCWAGMTVAHSFQAFIDYVYVSGTALGGSKCISFRVFSGGLERGCHNTRKDLY